MKNELNVFNYRTLYVCMFNGQSTYNTTFITLTFPENL